MYDNFPDFSLHFPFVTHMSHQVSIQETMNKIICHFMSNFVEKDTEIWKIVQKRGQKLKTLTISLQSDLTSKV